MKYMGSKARIASHISQYINDIAFTEGITEYYEPFMGGCSVGEVVRIQNRHLSDINNHMVALFKKVQEGMWEYKYITREEWYKIKDDRHKNKIYPAWLTGWCSVACSFRGRCFEGYAGEYPDSTSGKMVNPQLQVYNSLCKERPLLLGIDFQHRKYDEIGKKYHGNKHLYKGQLMGVPIYNLKLTYDTQADMVRDLLNVRISKNDELRQTEDNFDAFIENFLETLESTTLKISSTEKLIFHCKIYTVNYLGNLVDKYYIVSKIGQSEMFIIDSNLLSSKLYKNGDHSNCRDVNVSIDWININREFNTETGIYDIHVNIDNEKKELALSNIVKGTSH